MLAGLFIAFGEAGRGAPQNPMPVRRLSSLHRNGAMLICGISFRSIHPTEFHEP